MAPDQPYGRKQVAASAGFRSPHYCPVELPGLFLGTVVLGLVGGLIAAAGSKVETIIRVRGRGAEFQFIDTFKLADEVRRALSEPLMAIRKANAARADRPTEPAEPASDSVADQLSKLASLA